MEWKPPSDGSLVAHLPLSLLILAVALFRHGLPCPHDITVNLDHVMTFRVILL
jgi:hypothetical protein